VNCRGFQWLAVLVAAPFAFSAGLEPRVPNTTLQMPASPQTFGFATTNAFGSLSFSNPVAFASPPGETNRLFVIEQGGIIAVITNLANPARTVFLDLSTNIAGGVPNDEQGLLGLAFHPGFATNGFLYVFYTTAGVLRDRLSRFEVSPSDPNLARSDSEFVVLDQVDEDDTHNGGDLHFGPDGYLYVALGDEGCCNDIKSNSQTITKDFFSGILRLDVDLRPGNLAPNLHPAIGTNAFGAPAYAVPADNPFVGATNFNGVALNPNQVRTEFWAVGLRNPWRMSFDAETGALYCGDVGESAREEINFIQRGGNYGWASREGFAPGPKPAPPNFVFVAPILDLPHGSGNNAANALIGGVVYRGARIPHLYGAYVFADYASGRIWAARPKGTNTVPIQLLTTDARIAGFGIDPRNGDILLADQVEDTIKRLEFQSVTNGSPLPATLANTGAFSDLATLTPNPGILPYSVNVPQWLDSARATRWFCLPNTNRTIFFNPTSNWFYGTSGQIIWIQHIDLELTNGVAASARRVETRFLVRTEPTVYGVTYRWDSATNATLVPPEGLNESIVVEDGGTIRTQVWHYPSRSECLACHSAVGGDALGFNTVQLNRDYDYGAGLENQLAALVRVGYFRSGFSSPQTNVNTWRALAPTAEAQHSLEYRVRSYLAANCSSCHQTGGAAPGLWDAAIFTPLSGTGIVDGSLRHPDSVSSRVIKPGSLSDSALLARISTRGPGQMPPFGSSLPDLQAIRTVSEWITNSLVSYQTFAQWQSNYFQSSASAEAAAGADPDQDGANNLLEFLVGTIPVQGTDVWRVNAQKTASALTLSFPHVANRGFDVQWAASLSKPILWSSLNVPENRPFISATNYLQTVTEPLTNAAARFYRVHVFEP
jgi:glucose/arabinose dehydrogenase